jgi:hypothetical protein
MKKNPLYLLVLILVIWSLVGCSQALPVIEAEKTATPAPTQTPTLTSTPVPSPTPLPPVGVLLAPPEADPYLVEELQTFLSQAIPEAGYRFQVRPSLTAETIQAEDIGWVIALPPLPDLGALAAAAPETRFLAVGISGLEPGSNLSVIGADDARMDHQGFIAGYLAALITPDWRVGVIATNTETGQTARQAFVTGAKYFCGLCITTYPPFAEYPLYLQLDQGTSSADWQAASNVLINRGVETMYVVPGAGDEALLRHLVQSGVSIIGGTPPPDGLADSWVATLGFSPLEAFYQFWPDFVVGTDGEMVDVPLTIANINPDLFSLGRQRLVEEMLTQVQAGAVDLGVTAPEESTP